MNSEPGDEKIQKTQGNYNGIPSILNRNRKSKAVFGIPAGGPAI